MKRIPYIEIAAVVGVIILGVVSVSGNSGKIEQFGAVSPTSVTTSDTVQTLRQTVNSLITHVNSFSTTTSNTFTGHNAFATLTATSTVFDNATTTNIDITGLLTFNSVTGNEWTDFCSTITGGTGLCDGDDGGAFSWTPTTNFSTTTSATSTPLWLRGNRYSLFASSTSVFDYASTTALTVFGTATTSKFFADGLFTCNTENMLTWAGGVFGCEADTGGSAAWPFTTGQSTYGTTTQSTSTPLWLRGNQFSLFASSTAVFDNASTTFLTVNTMYAPSDLLTLSGTASFQQDIAAEDSLISSYVDNGTTYLQVSDDTTSVGSTITLNAYNGTITVSPPGTSAQGILSFTNIVTTNKTFTFPNWTGTFAIATGTLQTPLFVATSTSGSSIFPYASTTALTVSGTPFFTGLSSALLLANSSGGVGEYAGASCTNQFPVTQGADGSWKRARDTKGYITDGKITGDDVNSSIAGRSLTRSE